MTEKKSLLFREDQMRGSESPSKNNSSKTSEEYVSDDSEESVQPIKKKAYASIAED